MQCQITKWKQIQLNGLKLYLTCRKKFANVDVPEFYQSHQMSQYEDFEFVFNVKLTETKVIWMDIIQPDLKQLILKKLKLCTKIMPNTLEILNTHFELICNVKLNEEKIQMNGLKLYFISKKNQGVY